MYLVKRGSIYHLFYEDEYGKLKSKTTKCEKKSDAMKFLSNFEAEKKAEKLRPKERISFYSFEEVYKENVKNKLSKSYTDNIAISFKQFRKVITKDMPLDEITTVHIHKFINLKLAEPVGERVINGYLRALQSAFQRAIELGHLTENPFANVKKLKPVTNPPLFPTIDEVDIIIETEKDMQMKALYAFAYYTGMRLSEIRFLKWKSIRFDLNVISIENHEEFRTKSKQARTIPLNEALISPLKSIKGEGMDDNQYIFTHKGLSMTKNHISKAFKKAVRACKDADGKPIVNQELHFHSLRHGHASHLVMQNVELIFVRDLLGHESVKTTEIYAHLQNSSLTNAVKSLPKLK